MAVNTKPVFVIHQNSHRTPAYEFQLEIKGILKRWGLEVGPSVNPSHSYRAVPMADKPLEEMMREGLAPFEEHTQNTVMVWDLGTYRNLRTEREDQPVSMPQALAQGNLKVWLEGRKLRGGFELVRAPAGSLGDEVWKLSKMDDIGAGVRQDITGTRPESVLSGRTLEEVRAQELS